MSLMPGPAPTQMFDVFASGTTLGRNELLATIGEGGMARVILARQRGPMGFEKVVVVKVIHPDFAADRAAVGMLLDEARVAAQIDHPNVVQTYELGEAHGQFYIVMEYLAGESLQRIMKSVSLGASFDPRMAARIVADAANGLHAAHELADHQGNNLGVIHRDVSLGNIVVLYNGCVKVVDFGIAKTRDRVSGTTQRGQLKGKYPYMSPEQISDEPMDRRSDVFSLGVVLWECLALRRLFHADSVAGILTQVLEGPIVPPSQFRADVPPELDRIALKALARDPAKRYQTALEMKRALEDVIWQSRCDAGDVQMYMTAVFGDRMRKRQAMLASAATVRPSESNLLDPRALHDDSVNKQPAPALVLPRKLTERPVKKRSWLGGVLLAAGVMVGIGLGIRLVGGKFGHSESQAATTASETKVEPTAKVAVATPTKDVRPTSPAVQTPTAKTFDSEDMVPTMKSRLRPEHLEPVRVEIVEPEPQREPRAGSGSARTTKAEPAPVPEPVVTGPTPKELYDRASSLVIAGNVREAIGVYKQAVDKGYAPAHRGLGLAYQQMSMDGLAIESYRRYLALAPGASDAAAIRRRIEQLGGQP